LCCNAKASPLSALLQFARLLPNIQIGKDSPNDFAQAFSTMDREKPDAILMVTDSLTVLNRKRVFEYAAQHRLPAIYEFDWLVRDGGLMSYAPDLDESFGRVAALRQKIVG
jgi:putative tryptophan/tyrosine transport system substrate-binding protein